MDCARRVEEVFTNPTMGRHVRRISAGDNFSCCWSLHADRKTSVQKALSITS